MAMSGKERQKKWQEQQKSIGKKRVTIMLDKDVVAFQVTDAEHEVLAQRKRRIAANLYLSLCL